MISTKILLIISAIVIFVVIVIVFFIYYQLTHTTSIDITSGSSSSSAVQPTGDGDEVKELAKKVQMLEQHQRALAEQQRPKPVPGKDFEFTTKTTEPIMIMFWSQTCSHCHTLMPKWNDVVDAIGDDIIMKTISAQDNMEEHKYNDIKGWPNVRYYPEGYPSDKFIEYRGSRSVESLTKFATSGGKEV